MKLEDRATAAPPAPAADAAPAERPDKQATVAPIREAVSATGRSMTPLYAALVIELERQRHATGISQDMLSELMGTCERGYAKLIHPTTPSGRMAHWPMMQKVVDVLFCDGFILRIDRAKNGASQTTIGTKRKILASAVHYDRRTFRQHMCELSRAAGEGRKKIPWRKRVALARRAGKRRQKLMTAEQRCELAHRGAVARIKKQSPEERAQLARRAARARWARKNGEA